jgi:hypothetical protein
MVLGRLARQRRLARKKGFPDTFTKEQMQFMFEYWLTACAICQQQPGLLWTLSIDHWIPLASPVCPGTIASNLLPACHGTTGCNNSKGEKNPILWLTQKLGPRRAKKKLGEIETYFAAAQSFAIQHAQRIES